MREIVKNIARKDIEEGNVDLDQLAETIYKQIEDKEGCNLTDFKIFVKEAFDEYNQQFA